MNQQLDETNADDDSIDPRTIAFIQAFTALWPDAVHGPAHVVLSDYNVDDSCIESCIESIEKYNQAEPHGTYHSEAELIATSLFLQCLYQTPEDQR